MAVSISGSRTVCEAVSSLSESSLNDVGRIVPGFVTDINRTRINDVGVEGGMQEGKSVFKFRFRWNSPSTKTKQNWDEMINHKPVLRWGGLIQCDGGCHKRVSASQVEQFGSCDHNVCMNCLNTRAAVVFDGTPGCPNRRCLGFMSNSTSRSSSQLDVSQLDISTSELYMVNVLVLVFSLQKGAMGRKERSFEMTSGHALSEVKETLENLASDIEESRVFYTTAQKFRRKDLSELRLEEMDERRLETLSGEAEHLTIVVAGPGVKFLV